MVQGAAAHVGERRDLYRVAFEELGGLVESHEVIERVVERAKVGIDLLREIARQEAEALTGLDGGTHQNDAFDRVALERIDRACDGEIGLAGACGAGPERDVVFLDVLEVEDLIWRTPVQVRAAGSQLQGRIVLRRLFRDAGILPGKLDQAELNVVDGERLFRLRIKAFERGCGALDLGRCAAQGECRASARDGHVERRFHLTKVRIQRAAEIRERAII